MNVIKSLFAFTLLICLFTAPSKAQFIDQFNGSEIQLDPSANNGWAYYTGDGNAKMDVRAHDGHASIYIDATKDKRNIWWALIKRRVSTDIDMQQFSRPGYELRIEARVRTHTAPRRINLSVNTQRTTNFHRNLMEYNLPDTTHWHKISFVTDGFDVRSDDSVYVQLALMDWGSQHYRLDIDYYKVEVVPKNDPGPQYGTPVPYHPPVASRDTLTNHLQAYQDATIDLSHPDKNFNNWSSPTDGKNHLLNVSGSRYIIMRFDLERLQGKRVNTSGLLELHTHSLQRSTDLNKDFGMIRVLEIRDGQKNWLEENVSWNRLSQGKPAAEVFNPQTIIDVKIDSTDEATNLISINRAVLQRLLDGQTLGLAIKPLGAVNATFYGKESGFELAPKLHLSVSE